MILLLVESIQLMDRIVSHVKFNVNPDLFLKDPESSSIGKRILMEAINILDQSGFERLTFKELAHTAQTTESTVYRYFENKHMLILYLSNWYWSWLFYRLQLGLTNIPSGKKKLAKAIEILCRQSEDDNLIAHIDLVKLAHLIHLESGKIFRVRDVDQENKQGFYLPYKLLHEKMKNIILEVKETFPFAESLAASIIQGIHQQHFNYEHFPTLTSMTNTEKDIENYFLNLSLAYLSTPQTSFCNGK